MPSSGGRFGRERAAAGGDDDDLGEELRAGIGLEAEAAVGQPLELVDALAEVELRRRTA